jgi:hypothetical protein
LIDIDQCFSDGNDACYEAVASQEEIYLEETEEEVRSILISNNDSSKTQRLRVTDSREARQRPAKREPAMENELTTREGESLDNLDLAAEELIAGDSDDPPLSEETLAEMLGKARFSWGVGARTRLK